MKFQTELKKHLAKYKIISLGIREEGSWRNRPYPHILPKEHYKLNILETVREQFWCYYESGESGLKTRRHTFFHHLNSSQAMCFNLFFPFIMDNYRYLPFLLDMLGFPKENVSEVSFERILDEEEGTNFDFYIKNNTGMQILFEVKLSENDFGSTKNDKRHMLKYFDIYEKLIKNILAKKYQKPAYFFMNYQLTRLFSYLGYNDQTYIYFFVPLLNSSLVRQVDRLFPDILGKRFEDRVLVSGIEDFVSELISRCKNKKNKFLERHFNLFYAKYFYLSLCR